MLTIVVKYSHVGKLRAKNYNGDEDEWETILSGILLRKKAEGDRNKAIRRRAVDMTRTRNFGADDGILVARFRPEHLPDREQT